MHRPTPLLAIIVLLTVSSPYAHSQDIIIIKSSEIIPYQKAVEGFKSKFTQAHFKECVISEDLSGGESLVERTLKSGGELALAVGPEAAYLVGRSSSPIPKLFTMVANPEKLLSTPYPGVSLNLSPAMQIEHITMGFPQRKNIGILYTPELNQITVDTIMAAAAQHDVHIKAFPVSSKKDIPVLLNAPSFEIDILWIIPDRTIGSEKILKFLINQMLLKKIPVVGFNEWFAANGALLAFSTDYYAIGVQTAERAYHLLHGTPLLSPLIEEPSQVETIVNLKVARKLGVPIAPGLLAVAHEVIR